MSAIDQRMFYLMLSPIEGQSFAKDMGFAVPSEDVQQFEVLDIMSRWTTLLKSGLMQEVIESTDWFVEFLEKTDKINSPSEEFKAALTVFSASMLNKLMDSGRVGLILSEEELAEWESNEYE
jgi:hypothetical protein